MLDDRSMPSPTAVARSGAEGEGIAIKKDFHEHWKLWGENN